MKLKRSFRSNFETNLKHNKIFTTFHSLRSQDDESFFFNTTKPNQIQLAHNLFFLRDFFFNLFKYFLYGIAIYLSHYFKCKIVI